MSMLQLEFLNSCRFLIQHGDVDLSLFLSCVNEEDRDAKREWKENKKSLGKKLHPDMMIYNISKTDPKYKNLLQSDSLYEVLKAKVTRIFQDYTTAADSFETNYETFQGNYEVISILKVAFQLRNIFAELGTLDKSFPIIPLDLVTLKDNLQEATLQRDELVRKKSNDEAKKKQTAERLQRQEMVRKQHEEALEAEAKAKMIAKSKQYCKEIVDKIVHEIFLTNSCNSSTCYEGPKLSCCFNDCDNNSCSTYTILPCCESLLIHDCCLEKFLNNCLTDQVSDDTLVHQYQSNSFDSAKLKCPFCPTVWFGDNAIIASYDKGFHVSMCKKRSELYFNSVYFLLKNQRTNDLIKFESENIIMGTENDQLKRKISKLQEEVNLLKQKKFEAKSFLNTPFKDNLNTALMCSIDSNGKTDSDSDEQYNNEDAENLNNDQTNSFYSNDNDNYEYSIDNFNTNGNQILNQCNGSNNNDMYEITKNILKEVRDITYHKMETQMKCNKYHPRVATLTNGDKCLRCTFYPLCDQSYTYNHSKNKSMGGAKLSRFRNHKCPGIGNHVIKISIKKKVFLLENESK